RAGSPAPNPLVVRNADHWLWEATGASEGDKLDGMGQGSGPPRPAARQSEETPQIGCYGRDARGTHWQRSRGRSPRVP
ncbi:hypothetical protein AB0C60_32115, partial [Streptomyces sp. NPDC048845]